MNLKRFRRVAGAVGITAVATMGFAPHTAATPAVTDPCELIGCGGGPDKCITVEIGPITVTCYKVVKVQ
jgi:hypothetical protein